MKAMDTPSGAPGVKKNKTMNNYKTSGSMPGETMGNMPSSGSGGKSRGGGAAVKGFDYKVK